METLTIGLGSYEIISLLKKANLSKEWGAKLEGL
jgi:hypothetical protein